jgi:hypothetical protein
MRVPTGIKALLAATLIVALSVASAWAVAQSAESTPWAAGDYATASGTGRLKITAATDGVQHFSIESRGSQGHRCAVDGTLQGGLVMTSPTLMPIACRIGFAKRGDAIEVSTNAAADCGPSFCEARATFVGRYAPAASKASAKAKAKH